VNAFLGILADTNGMLPVTLDFINRRIILMMLILQVVRLIGIFRVDISLTLTKIKLTISKKFWSSIHLHITDVLLCSNDFHGEYLSCILHTTILQYILNRRSTECS
jgi:hypothetical protein